MQKALLFYGARIIWNRLFRKEVQPVPAENAGKYGLIFSKHIEGKFAFVKRSETTKSQWGL